VGTNKAVGQGPAGGQQGRHSGSIDEPALTANNLWLAATDRTNIHKRQDVCPINQSIY